MSLEDGRGSAADNADGITRRRHAGWTEKAGDATMLMAHLRPAGRCPRPTRPARPGTRRVMRSTKRADAAQPPTTRTASRTRHRASWTEKAGDATVVDGTCARPGTVQDRPDLLAWTPGASCSRRRGRTRLSRRQRDGIMQAAPRRLDRKPTTRPR